MSRSGYSDDLDSTDLNLYRGTVAMAMRGKRGQRFFRDLAAALDAMPEKRLVAEEFQAPDGEVCALGCLMRARGLDVPEGDNVEAECAAEPLDIARSLANETTYENDECGPHRETPEERWVRMRKWAAENIREESKP